MKDASDEILNKLRSRGYRITEARIQVVGAFVSSHEPLSTQEVTERVAVDMVSVYRTIATLKKEKLIEEINTQGGMSRYEIAHGHHHHLVCVGCNLLVHLPCEQEIKAPRLNAQFADISSHELTFYGTCTKCA